VIPVEAEILRKLSVPGVRKLILAPSSRGFIGIVSISSQTPGAAKTVGMAVLSTSARLKTVIVVDSDIDPANWGDVEWALSTRMQPHRDVVIIPAVAGTEFDPSIPDADRSQGLTSKMIIDATKHNPAQFPVACLPKPDVLAEVERNWQAYGIP
jgi:4-hydroxy-3-polyprenylbenzoate decarboxylase